MTSRSPIQILAHSPVATGSVVWRQGAVTGATIIVKATFGLVPGGNARLVAPIGLVHEDRYRASPGAIPGTFSSGETPKSLEDASELAPYLPSAGVIVHGVAHALPGQSTRATSVRLGIFRDAPLLNKVLHVIGNRTRETQASPQPFDTMPLVYERAYGGPSTSDNPVGTGAQPGSPLPNVVDPTSPERPNGFGPIAKQWGPRRRLLGNRPEPTATELAEGIDWRWFHAAPPDQQIPSLKGNEWIVLDGMHRSHASLRTRLPDVRAHARWQVLGRGVNSPLRALDLVADTLVLMPERQVCCVIWRGHVVVSAADASLLHANVALELVGYPLPPVFGVHEEPLYAATERIAAPGDASAAKPANASPKPPAAPAISSALLATASAVIEPRGSALPFRKPDASSPAPEAASKPSRPADLDFRSAKGDDDGSTQMIDADNLPARPAVPSHWARPSNPRSGPVGSPDDEFATQMIDLDALSARSIAPFELGAPGAQAARSAAIPGAPWSPPSESELAELTASDLVTVETGRPPPPRDGAPSPAAASSRAPGSDDGPMTVTTLTVPVLPARPAPVVTLPTPEPVVAAEPDRAPESEPPTLMPTPSPLTTAKVPVSTAPVEPPGSTGSPVGAPGSTGSPVGAPGSTGAPSGVRATVIARLASGESLVDLALAGADLKGLDLSGVVLARANLDRADLAKSKLVNANLAGAQLADVDLTEADLSGADLAKADLSRARLQGARLDGAILSDANLAAAEGRRASFEGATAVRARFARGVWDDASFRRMDGTGADFTAAAIADAHFDGATLAEARLDDAKGQGAVFDEARLSQARLTGASLVGARLGGVDARGSIWERATLDGASFPKANLKDANLSRATGQGASFVGAELSGANLQRLNADGADLREARLVAADLRQARLRDASFVKADLRDALGGKADLEGCRFTRAILQNASFRGARLQKASFAYADLEGIDLRDAELTGVNVFGASRKTAKLGAGAKAVVEEDPGDEA